MATRTAIPAVELQQVTKTYESVQALSGQTVALSMSLLIVMSFATGVFVPMQYLPEVILKIAPYLPNYHLTQLAWTIVGSTNGDGQSWTHVLNLLAFAAGFSVLAGWAYLRDENKNFT